MLGHRSYWSTAPGRITIDLAALAVFPRPALLTHGDQSPACFPPVVTTLAAVLPRAETRVFAGAGRLPMVTHPADDAAAIAAFANTADAGPDPSPHDETLRLVQLSVTENVAFRVVGPRWGATTARTFGIARLAR